MDELREILYEGFDSTNEELSETLDSILKNASKRALLTLLFKAEIPVFEIDLDYFGEFSAQGDWVYKDEIEEEE